MVWLINIKSLSSVILKCVKTFWQAINLDDYPLLVVFGRVLMQTADFFFSFFISTSILSAFVSYSKSVLDF